MAKYLSFDITKGETILKTPTINERVPYEIVQTNKDGVIDKNLLPDMSSAVIIQVKANEDIPVYKSVVINTNGANLFRYYINSEVHGISISSAKANDEVSILIHGYIPMDRNPFGNNVDLYVHDNGIIQTGPYPSIMYKIGRVIDNKLIIEKHMPIYLEED